jgi:hypothetical protein
LWDLGHSQQSPTTKICSSTLSLQVILPLSRVWNDVDSPRQMRQPQTMCVYPTRIRTLHSASPLQGKALASWISRREKRNGGSSYCSPDMIVPSSRRRTGSHLMNFGQTEENQERIMSGKNNVEGYCWQDPHYY